MSIIKLLNCHQNNPLTFAKWFSIVSMNLKLHVFGLIPIILFWFKDLISKWLIENTNIEIHGVLKWWLL